MQNSPLGFAPAVVVAAKIVPGFISILGGKKKEKAAKRMAEYQRNEAEIMAGRAIMATDVFTPGDAEFLRRVWGQIRAAARFSDINWAATGYPQGPALSPAGLVAIDHVWPSVRAAGSFNDVNWQYHAIPNEKIAPVLPPPELNAPIQYPGYSQGQTEPSWPSSIYDPNRAPLDPKGTYRFAGILPGGFSMTPQTVLVIAALGVAGLILFSDRR